MVLRILALGLMVLAAQVAAARDELRDGARIRLKTVPPDATVDGLGYRVPGAVVDEDDASVTYAVPGSEGVTLSKSHHWIVGKLLGSDGESLTLDLQGRRGLVQIHRRAITRLEMSRGRPRRKAALIGAAVSGALVAASAIGDPDCFILNCDMTPAAWIGVGAFAAAEGALLGAFIFGGSERWRPVVDSPPLPKAHATRRGVWVGVTLRF